MEYLELMLGMSKSNKVASRAGIRAVMGRKKEMRPERWQRSDHGGHCKPLNGPWFLVCAS